MYVSSVVFSVVSIHSVINFVGVNVCDWMYARSFLCVSVYIGFETNKKKYIYSL